MELPLATKNAPNARRSFLQILGYQILFSNTAVTEAGQRMQWSDAGLISSGEAAWDRQKSQQGQTALHFYGWMLKAKTAVPSVSYTTKHFGKKYWINLCVCCSTKFLYSLTSNFLHSCFYWKQKVWPLVILNWSWKTLSCTKMRPFYKWKRNWHWTEKFHPLAFGCCTFSNILAFC